MRPIDGLLPWMSRLFGDYTTLSIFAPLLADWQRDRDAATKAWRRALRDVSGAAALGMTAAQVAVRLGLPRGLPGSDLRAIGATLALHAAFGLALGLAPVLIVPIVAGPARLAFLAWMAPAMLAVSLTVALLPTAAVIQRRSRHGWATRAPWLLAAVTLASMVALLAHIGWVTPLAKQAFRVRSLVASATVAAMSGPDGDVRGRRTAEHRAQGLPRGVNELTLTELLSTATPERVYPQVTPLVRRREAVLRFALVTVWPVAFALFGWRLARHRRTLGVLGLSGWWTLAVITSLTVSFGGFESSPRQLSAVATAAVAWLVAAAALRGHVRSEHATPSL